MNRVGGQLAITRSLGDHGLRTEGVIPNPYISKRILKTSDKWLVIASDGVWDHVQDPDVRTIIGLKEESAKNAAQKIAKTALERGSQDNITCLVVKL